MEILAVIVLVLSLAAAKGVHLRARRRDAANNEIEARLAQYGGRRI